MNEPDLTLYYSPKACSLASHILLEESGLPFTATSVDIRGGENNTPAYRAINPNGSVPTLTVGTDVITESHAILVFVADQVPERQLLPKPGSVARARAHEWLNWTSSSLHASYTSIFKPEVFAGNNREASAAVRSIGHSRLSANLLEIERRLGDSAHALGEFSAVDAYLFVFYVWSFDERIQIQLPSRPRYTALAEQIWGRPTTRAAVARERAVRSFPLPPGFSI